MQAFKVYENGKHIDTVFFVESMTAEEVRKSLINHDGYSEEITVKKGHSMKTLLSILLVLALLGNAPAFAWGHGGTHSGHGGKYHKKSF
jgi:hypothetical protein